MQVVPKEIQINEEKNMSETDSKQDGKDEEIKRLKQKFDKQNK